MTDTFMQTILGVSALLLLVLLTRRSVARHFGPRVAYALWLLPIARLFMPTIDLPRAWLPSLFVTQPEPVLEPASTLPPEALFQLLQNSPQIPVTTQSDAAHWVLPLLLAIWVGGIAVGLAWAVLSQVRQGRYLRETTHPACSSLSSDIDRAVRLSGLKIRPDVRISAGCDGPLVCGLFKPAIVLPQDFETRFTAEQRRMALLHEMLHVRRGDLWASSAMLAFRLIHWPNPLVHWAWPRFRADQEAACDANVLRCIGEHARSDYAETLLTAATTAGRANPVPGTGLTLSLHHPVKERLMTLGSNMNNKRGLSRWALGAMLLAGTALSAPLSLADDQAAPDTPEVKDAPKVVTKNVSRWVVSKDDDGEHKGFEIREENGVKTYLRVSRDGTTEKMTREQLAAEYGEDFDTIIVPPTLQLRQTIDGEPGLSALASNGEGLAKLRAFMVEKHGEGHDRIEIEVEDGERRIFKIDEDGTKTEIDLEDVDNVQLKLLGKSDFDFPMGLDGKKVMMLNTDETHVWNHDGEGGENVFAFQFGSGAGMAATEARLNSAKAMIEATDRMLDDMRADADGAADRDLRDAEKELAKAQKALEKAMENIRKSESRD